LTQAGKLEQAGLEAGIGRSWKAGIPRSRVLCTLDRISSSKLEEWSKLDSRIIIME
jgi:hypothetical protein